MMYEVYRNLHNGKWSIRDSQTKLVVGHAISVRLQNVSYIVGESGRQRVIKEKAKNVHAFAKGELTSVLLFQPFKDRLLEVSDPTPFDKPVWWSELYYNPYKLSSFIIKRNQRPINRSCLVDLNQDGSVHGGFVSE